MSYSCLCGDVELYYNTLSLGPSVVTYVFQYFAGPKVMGDETNFAVGHLYTLLLGKDIAACYSCNIMRDV